MDSPKDATSIGPTAAPWAFLWRLCHFFLRPGRWQGRLRLGATVKNTVALSRKRHHMNCAFVVAGAQHCSHERRFVVTVHAGLKFTHGNEREILEEALQFLFQRFRSGVDDQFHFQTRLEPW